MEYQPQASLSDRKLQYLSLLGYPSEEVTSSTYDLLSETVANNPPDFGDRLNETVVQNALSKGLNQDVLTGILAAGPPIRLMVEKELPTATLTQELVGLTKNYYQKQIDLKTVNPKDFVANASFVLQRAENSISVAIFNAYGKAAASFGHLVVAAKNTENAVLGAVPLGLGHLAKKGLQLSAPAILLSMGEHFPVISGGVKVLNVGIEAVSAFGSAKIGAFAQSHYLSTHLPQMPSIDSGFFAPITNAAKGAYYQGQVFAVEQKANLVKAWATGFSHTVFSVGAPNVLLLGAVAGSKKFTSIIREGAVPFSGLATQAKFVISKSQKFIQEKFSMSQQNGKQGNLTAAQAEYMRLLKDYLPTQGMDYEQIKQAHPENSERTFAANQYVASAALIEGKTPSEARKIVEASPGIASDLERGATTQSSVFHYLQEVESLLVQQQSHLQSSQDLSSKKNELQQSLDDLQSKKEEPIQVSEPIASPQMSDQDKAISQGILATLGTTFGVEKSKHAQINYNGEVVFKRENYVGKQDINSPEARHAADMFQKALSDPSNVKGDVKISIGGQLLVHVEDGVILAGHQFIKDTSAKVEVNSPEKALYDKYSSTVQATGYDKTRQTAAIAFNAGKTPEEVRSILSHDPSFKKYEDISPEMNSTMLLQENAQAQAVGKGVSLEKQAERTKEVAIVA